MSEKVCEACGAKIQFINGPNARPIPAQRVRTVYFREDQGAGGIVLKPAMRSRSTADPKGPDLYVSHFETCSDPARFSKR